jgi:hypothetical protein
LLLLLPPSLLQGLLLPLLRIPATMWQCAAV